MEINQVKFKHPQVVDSKCLFGEWAKHHKQVGLLVHCEYPEGEKVETTERRKQLLSDKRYVRTKPRTVVNFQTGQTRKAIDYYVTYENTRYAAAIERFDTGASNTSTYLGLRYKFLLDDNVFWLDHRVAVSGNFPLMYFIDDLEDFLLEAAEKDVIERYGIKIDDECDDTVVVYVVSNETGAVDYISIELQELLDCFVGFEVYKSFLKIND